MILTFSTFPIPFPIRSIFSFSSFQVLPGCDLSAMELNMLSMLYLLLLLSLPAPLFLRPL